MKWGPKLTKIQEMKKRNSNQQMRNRRNTNQNNENTDENNRKRGRTYHWIHQPNPPQRRNWREYRGHHKKRRDKNSYRQFPNKCYFRMCSGGSSAGLVSVIYPGLLQGGPSVCRQLLRWERCMISLGHISWPLQGGPSVGGHLKYLLAIIFGKEQTWWSRYSSSFFFSFVGCCGWVTGEGGGGNPHFTEGLGEQSLHRMEKKPCLHGVQLSPVQKQWPMRGWFWLIYDNIPGKIKNSSFSCEIWKESRDKIKVLFTRIGGEQ